MASLEFFDHPAAFLDAAGAHLAADPVLGTVVATIAHRLADEGAPPPHDRPQWWVVARDRAGRVVGVAMRTAPLVRFPLYVLPMPDDAARALAQALHGRGEEVLGVNGADPAAVVVADEVARLQGHAAHVHERTRLFDLLVLVEPVPVAGRLREATHADAEVCLAWFSDFARAAAEQAGRPFPDGEGEQFDHDEIVRRVDAGRIALWEVDGEVVHLTGFNAPAFGVARIGPVYTPRDQRGRGWASAAVAAVSGRMLEAGVRPCLFTDQANPTSNRVYEALGYRQVVDMVNLVVTPVTTP